MKLSNITRDKKTNCLLLCKSEIYQLHFCCKIEGDKTKSDIEHTTLDEENEEGTGSEEENEETIIEETYKETDDGIVWRTIRKTTVITPKQTTEKFEVLGGITSTLPCLKLPVFGHIWSL